MTTYTQDMLVSVRQFTRQADGDDVMIGSVETGSFLAVPPEAVDVLDYLAAGNTIADTQSHYLTKYGETLDIDDFLGIMESKGFVAGESSADIDGQALSKLPTLRYHFSTFPQSLAAMIYSPVVMFIMAGTSVLAMAALISDRSLVPRSSDFVFQDHRVLSFVVFIALALAGTLLHELSHVVAARSLGVNTRLALGHRLWFLVAEADLTGLWGVPKHRRYLPLLAGMLTDVISAAALVLLLFAHNHHWIVLSSFVVTLSRALVLSYWLRIVWQFYVFVRTDMYFVAANFFDCKNLLKDTEDFLKNLASPFLRWIQVVDQSAIPAFELRVIRAYSVLWIGGRILSLYVLFSVTFPVGVSYLRSLRHSFQMGSSAGLYSFIDSLILSSFFLVTLGAGLFLWIRGMIRGERT